MAQRPSVVTAEVTSVPDPTEIARVADFVREPFVTEGEDPAAVLAPGSIRRHAFEFARAELDAGAAVPSQKWRRRWSLLLGLDRTLNATTPVLADGTTLNPHQIDALSGTYAALLADAQRRASGGSGSDGDALLLSFEDEDPTELEEPPAQVTAEDDDESHDDEGPSADEDEDDEELESLDEQLVELPDAEPESESSLYDDLADEDVDEDIDRVALEDPNAHKRFWFEHATGAGKTVAAMGFVEACRTGGILILTHRRNLVDQFQDELRTRGYGERLSKPLLTDADGNDPNPDVLGPVTIETYQWFVRNAGRISGAYTVVICDEAHTALGDKTSAAIRAWTGPIFIGMTATGALIARHVADLFPTQTSRFDLAQAARRGVIAPLRCLRIPPGPGVRTIAKVPLRKGEVDMEFDQDELAKLLDQAPFNLAIADLYKTRFRNTPGVVYTAGVQHAYNVAESFRALGMKAQAVSGETPKRELANILAEYDAGEIDVLINAQLLAEGWNSPRATICMHLAPTASKRIYQQRVGRVTRRHPGKEAGVVIDFVHPATPNDDPVVTLHSLLDRDVYRGGAIVVGPVRRGRGRRVKVERRVLPVTPNIERRRQVFERELWRIAVEQLDWGEQRVWAALAGAKASPSNWRRGRAMLNFDRSGELRRQFLITALERNRSPQLRMRAIQEIALLREAEPFDTAIDFIGQWPRDERREASRTMLQAMADRRIGRRDQATAWIWRLAEYTRDVHEEYAAQRWPATKHLLGLLVNSSGAAHARNARRLVHGARQHDRRLQAALLAAAVAHTPEAEEVLREARTRLARKPGALSRDLLKDFPNGKRRKKRTRKRRGGGANGEETTTTVATDGTTPDGENAEGTAANGVTEANGNGQNGNGNGQSGNGSSRSRRGRSRGGRRRNRGGGSSGEGTPQNGAASAEATPQNGAASAEATPQNGDATAAPETVEAASAPERDAPAVSEDAPPVRRRVRGQKAAAAASATASETTETTGAEPAGGAAPNDAEAAEPKPTARRTRTRKTAAQKAAEAEAAGEAAAPAAAPAPAPAPVPADETVAEKPVRRTRTRKTTADTAAEATTAESVEAPAEKPVRATRARKTAAQKAAEAAAEGAGATTDAPAETASPAKKPATRARKTAAQKAAEAAEAAAAGEDAAPAKKPATRTRKTAAQRAAEAAAPGDDVATAEKAAPRRTTTRKTAAQKAAEAAETATTDDAPAKKPATRTRKTAAQKAAEAAAEAPAAEKPATRTRKTAAQKAAEAAAAGDDVAPAKKPATRRTTTAKTATAKTTATAAAKKPAVRKTAAQKAAEAAEAATTDDAPAKKPATRTRKTAAQKAAATGDDTAPAKKPATRRTTTAKTATAKTTATAAAKKPAARKTAAQKAADAAATDVAPAKTTTARKTTTRRKTTPTPEEA